MLHLLRGIRISGMRTKALHPGVCDAVHEDDGGLDELSGGVAVVMTRCAIPSPTKLRERPEESRESDKTVTPEDGTLCRDV